MTSILLLNALIYACGWVPVPSASDLLFVSPQIIYTSIIASFIGILCWNAGNKILTPLNGVLFMDIVPITAFSISAMAGVEPGYSEIAGACITGSALILNNLYLRYRTSARKVIPAQEAK